MSTQDNRPYYTTATLPECASTAQEYNTHLILFASADGRDLSLVSWNCSSGFTDQRGRIAAFLRPGRAYLALANSLTSSDAVDQRVYVLYDDGAGPAIEEWQVPPGGQHADWKVLGSVPVNVTGS